MLREEKIQPGLHGTKRIEVRRRLVARIMKVTNKGAYKTVDIPVSGLKVVGIMVRQRSYADQPIKAFYRYSGVGAAGLSSEAFIESLNKELMKGTYGVVTVDAGAGEKIYIAQPVELDQAIITYNGFEGGFNDPVVVSVTDDVTGAQQDYYLYESVNENLGATTLEITNG